MPLPYHTMAPAINYSILFSTHTTEQVDDGVEEKLVSLNKHLRPFGLELCKTRLEDREENWYAVVNRNPDAAAKIASKFTPQELEFFNKMVHTVSLFTYGSV